MAQVTCGKIWGNGVHQADIYNMLYNLKESLNGILTHCDADGTLTDTDYNSTLAVSLPTHGFSKQGMSQDDITTYLKSFTTNFNLALAKLDADDAVVTTYVSGCAITVTISPAHYVVHRMEPNGVGQGDLVWFLDYVRSRIALLTAKLDGSGGVASTDYAATYNVTDVIDSVNT
jgi:hypothetical protein